MEINTYRGPDAIIYVSEERLGSLHSFAVTPRWKVLHLRRWRSIQRFQAVVFFLHSYTWCLSSACAAQNFRMGNRVASAYYSRVFNRRCDEYTNTGNLCLPTTIPIHNLDRSASNSRVSTAAVNNNTQLLSADVSISDQASAEEALSPVLSSDHIRAE